MPVVESGYQGGPHGVQRDPAACPPGGTHRGHAGQVTMGSAAGGRLHPFQQASWDGLGPAFQVLVRVIFFTWLK